MSLYELERTGDVQELVRYLRESDNDRVRARAAETLGNFPDHDDRNDAVTALVEVARTDDDRVAANAVDSLDELGGNAIDRLITTMAGVDFDRDDADEVKVRAFARALDADVPELRMAAANALGRLERSDSVDELTDCFDDPDPRVRARAARACGKIAAPRTVTSLEGLLTDPKAAVRRAAADALGGIGDRRALQALLPLYEDDDERVRRIAVSGFGNFDTDRPVDYLVEGLTDDSRTVRRTAVYSLIELLSNVPTDSSHDVRDTVVSKLSAVNDRSVVVPLAEILEESTQPAQQRNAAWLLGRITGETERRRVIDALVASLDGDDQLLRQFAATSLVEIGGDDVEKPLLDVVTDEDRDPDVRGQAIFTLGKVGGERSRQTLESIVDETEHDAVRNRAASAVSRLSGRQ